MMNRIPTANSTAGGYVLTPTQRAIVFRPPRQSDSAVSTMPVASQSSA